MNGRRRRVAALALTVTCCGSAATLLLAFDVAAAPAAIPPAGATRPPAKPLTTLLSRFGSAATERLLASDDSKDRRRALVRLSGFGTPHALELLAKALDPGGAARGAEEHLLAVRALAPHASVPTAREALVRVLSSPPAEGEARALSDWVRASAALALARTQDPAALSALGRALRKPGSAAELSQQALLAHPPRDLAPLLSAPGVSSKALCETLGALGDRRAEATLREVVRRGTPEARASAALALQRLGSGEVVVLARHWLHSERQPALLVAAAEVLIRAAEPDAGSALAQLAENDATREAALSLALQSDGSVPIPKRVDLRLAAERAGQLLELWARSSSPADAALLEQTLERLEFSGLASHALARSPKASAGARLKQALHQSELRPLALRALALRSHRLREDDEALLLLLPGYLRSKSPAERAAAAFSLGLLRPAELPRLLGSNDAVVVRAAARLASTGEAAQVAVARLLREPDPLLRVALSIGLADPRATEQVPTALLLALAQAGEPGCQLAATALAARNGAALDPFVRELLASRDPWLRSHTLFGLGRARDPSVLGLIVAAYRFEPEASVRHAAVVALSQRPEPLKRRTLRLAAELDASPLVREAAALALSGHALGQTALQAESLWLELPRTPALQPKATPAALLRSSQGLALPLVADPDGVLTFVGADFGPVELRLALPGDRVNGLGANR